MPASQSRSVRFLRIWILSVVLLAVGEKAVWALSIERPFDRSRPPVGPSVHARAGDEWPRLIYPYRHFEGELSPLEVRLFADAADGRWDEFSLLGAALVASGVNDPQRLHRYQMQVAEWVGQLCRSGPPAGSPKEQAQTLFEFMHRRILHGGYQLDSTDLILALEEGRFNCVSASVLFNCLAGQFGMATCGLEIPGHAMSRLFLPGETIDVETTCPSWFRLMNDPKKQAAAVEKAIGRRLESRSSQEPREVSPVELVATIYYNRGVDLLGQEWFDEAVSANAKALRLDPANNTSRGNLLATLNNWAINLGSAGHYAEAVELLDQGLAVDPTYETFRVNYVHVHHQWVESLCGRGRFQPALDVLAAAIRKQPDEAYFFQARLDVYRHWARVQLEAGQAERALALFDQAGRIHGNRPKVLDVEAAEVNRRALALLEEGRFDEALTLLDRALARQPDSSLLSGNRRSAVMRWAQPAFESGDYPEAIRRSTYGATPDRLHETLVNNVRYGYHRWISELLTSDRRAEARQIARQAMADPFLGGRIEGAIPPAVWN